MQATDAHKIVGKFGSPHARRGGAKTRGGALCRNLAVRGMKRCRMHGGKSLAGIAHPNYKHGFYSKHCSLGMVLRAAACDRGRRARLERKIAQTLAAEAAAHDERAQREAARRKPFTAESMQALLAALADRNKT